MLELVAASRAGGEALALRSDVSYGAAPGTGDIAKVPEEQRCVLLRWIAGLLQKHSILAPTTRSR